MDPAVSVIVSTRNRPEHVSECVASILANPSRDFELLVVDQSDGDDSRKALDRLSLDPRLCWLPSDTRGLSASRNVAVAAARAPILMFTDDDCRVPPTWVESTAMAFHNDLELMLLFGAVLLRPEDRASGYAAEFEPESFRELRDEIPDMRAAWGVGANMTVRRHAFERLGTFDPVLGAGAPFHAGEEIDLTIRALTAGLKVAHTPAISVLHLGIRKDAEASQIMRRYGIGFGATFGKHVRLGTPGSARALAHWVAHHSRRSIGNALRGHKQPGLGLVASVVWGACQSIIMPLDRKHAIFKAKPDESTGVTRAKSHPF